MHFATLQVPWQVMQAQQNGVMASAAGIGNGKGELGYPRNGIGSIPAANMPSSAGEAS
jgi:hypothetical protein